MSSGFQQALDQIRSIADSEAQKGRLFERLMKKYFSVDPIYGERFRTVWLWSDMRASFCSGCRYNYPLSGAASIGRSPLPQTACGVEKDAI